MAKKTIDEFSSEEEEQTPPEKSSTVSEFPVSFVKYAETRPDLNKYQVAYIGATVRGQIKTKSEWDAVVAKNL